MSSSHSLPQTSGSRRSFRILQFPSFAIPRNVKNACFDIVTYLVDGFIYLLGPFLIIFATVIIIGLTHSFFNVILPMMERANPGNTIFCNLNICFVVFILANVVSNYFLCVTTKHKGPLYDKIVRELADVTSFVYPETPQDIQQFKRDYEDRMLLRIHRRQVRAREQAEQAAPHTPTASSAAVAESSVTQRKNTQNNNNNNNNNNAEPAAPRVAPTTVRRWMVMAPNEWGYCNNTHQPKPPRSHYDHVSKTLVLNMDHYCPWMFNCVGFLNYRYFYNFLLFVFVGMMYGVCVATRPFARLHGEDYWDQVKKHRTANHGPTLHLYDYVPTPEEKTAVAFSFLLCLSVGLAVATLLGFHTYLLLTGQTTIEFHGNCANRRRVWRTTGRRFKNPYDLGWKQNFRQIYGDSHPLVAVLVPSNREPEYLPLPLPGDEGKRRSAKKVDGEVGPNIV